LRFSGGEEGREEAVDNWQLAMGREAGGQMTEDWRLILDDKRCGFCNMALDEAILIDYPRHKIPTLRIYGWREPFISLGYNQDSRVVLGSTKIPFVRRVTGGSAIFHDQEVTYSITCASGDLNLPKRVKDSYESLCLFLIEFYSRLNLEAKFARTSALAYQSQCSQKTPKQQRSLHSGIYENFCFSSCEEFDLVIDGKKIGGNAQRRRKNLIFQQGSIPQRLDFALIKKVIAKAGKLEQKTTFLDGIVNKKTDFYYLCRVLADSFKSVFNVHFIKNSLFKEERETFDYLVKHKYTAKEWNNKSSSKFVEKK